MLRWTPSALIGVASQSLRVGAEYLFARNLGIDIEAGPELTGFYQEDPPSRGWNVYATPKAYFGMNRHGRGFLGMHLFYRRISQDGGTLAAFATENTTVTSTQRSSLRTTSGGGICGGYMAHLGAGLHIELCNGVGLKEVRVDRDIVMPALSRQEGSGGIPREREVFERASLAYFICELKIAWLIGGYRRPSN